MFTRWTENKSLLWLHGKAGCGKTVLSSTIINEVIDKCRHESGIAVAYFYFDFNDVEKQKSDKMVHSLITQLCAQIMEDTEKTGMVAPSLKKVKELESMFSFCGSGERQPNADQLMLILKDLFEYLGEIYIILDALDECLDQEELLGTIKEIQEWNPHQLHMLLTSRRLTDLEEMLDEVLKNPRDKICIQGALVNADILIYVHERLENDRKLKRWRDRPKVQEEIKVALMNKADGM